MIRRIGLLLLLVLASSFPEAEALAEPAARRVYLGVYLHDVTRFDQRSGTYDVDLDVWVKWRGDFDPAELRVQNAAGELFREDFGESHDGDWHSDRWRIRGTLRGEFPVQRFPFDVQRLPVVFELPEGRGELVPDLAGSGMAESFSITGWKYEPTFDPDVERVVYASDLGTIEREGRATTMGRVRFTVTLTRPTVTIAVKLFLPLALLLLISLIAFFLGPELVEARTSIGVTVLLACFAFQFTIAGTMPDVSYLTIADSLFIVAYALTGGALVLTVIAYWLHRAARERAALWLDRATRVGLPLVAVALSLWLLAETPARAIEVATDAPHAERPRSARDVVRVGTLSLSTPSGGALRGALRSGLVEGTADGESVAALAEEAPSVSNDMLRFHSNGTLEVRWRLRDGLEWSDGDPLTSDDFRFALEVSPDPHVLRIETPDPRTLVLTYDDALAAALYGLRPLPRHELGGVGEDGGYEAVREERRSRPIAGTGPYRVTSFTVNDRLVMEANPHFTGPAPSIARVEIVCFEDADAMVRAFDTGEIDIVPPKLLSLEQASGLEARAPGNVLERASSDLIALSPDLTVPLLSKLSVRRAILQAIDRGRLAREVFGDFGFVAETPAVGIAPSAEDGAHYDPAASRVALEAEGAMGAPLVVSHADRPIDATIAVVLEEQLEAVGFAVERRALPSGRSRARDHGGLLVTTLRSDDDSDPRRYWNLERTAGRFAEDTRNDAYDDATADLVRRWKHALYAERRAQLRDRLALAVASRLPILPLMFAPETVAAVPSLDGWDGGERFGDTVADWHFVEEAPAPMPASTTAQGAP